MQTRISSIREILSESTAAIIISPQNRRYLTGFPSSAGILIITSSHAVFLIDGRYYEAAREQVKSADVMLQKELKSQLPEILAGKEQLLCETSVTVAEIRDIARLSGIPADADDSLENKISSLRKIKNAEELENIKQAQNIAEAGFSYILGYIKEGITETEIALELEFFMRKNGAESAAFDTIAVSGENSSRPHGVPSRRKLQRGDFLTLDFGAVYKGYRSDMTRTVAIGSVTDEMRLVYETVFAANIAAIKSVRAGIPAAECDSAARDVISAAGFGEYFSHGTGHGVGLDIHENPRVSPASDDILESGNIITAEPGIYLPGKFGVRIEDLLLVTSGGSVNLTNSPKELIITPALKGRT